MIIYRLERQDGWGAFCDAEGIGGRIITYAEDSIYMQYGCSVQSINNHGGPHRFGCESLDDLVAYFGSDFAKLIGLHNCNVVAYKVHKAHVKFGIYGTEVAFLYEKAEKITL